MIHSYVRSHASERKLLKKHVVLRGMFRCQAFIDLFCALLSKMAVKAVPYWKDFVKALGTTSSGVASESDVLIDMRQFTETLGELIRRINEFYSVHKLDVDYTV